MKYAVIDIGSNSVRLMMSENNKTLTKKMKITRLAEGLSNGRSLIQNAIERTALAVSFFVSEAKEEKADKIYAFATAAARRADNSQVLLDRVKELCGVDIEIISGEKEAEIGVLGALLGRDGGIIDIGGASSEIIVIKGSKQQYCFSLDVGVVKITEKCGQDKAIVEEYLDKEIEKYGAIPNAEFYAIGGTACTVSSMIQQLEVYDPKKVHGHKIYKEELYILAEKLYSMTVEERKGLKGLQLERAEVIAGGVVLLYKIMDKIGLRWLTVSESDNLEGYLIQKEGFYD